MKCAKNTSSRYVQNDIEKKVLSKDLKFCINSDKLDYCQTLTSFEKRVRTLKNQLICCNSSIDFNSVKAKLKDIALPILHGYSPNILPLNVSRAGNYLEIRILLSYTLIRVIV